MFLSTLRAKRPRNIKLSDCTLGVSDDVRPLAPISLAPGWVHWAPTRNIPVQMGFGWRWLLCQWQNLEVFACGAVIVLGPLSCP